MRYILKGGENEEEKPEPPPVTLSLERHGDEVHLIAANGTFRRGLMTFTPSGDAFIREGEAYKSMGLNRRTM